MKINVKSDCRGMTGGQVVDQVLSDRGIENEFDFLNPHKEDMLPLEDLENIDDAAQIVLSYVEGKKKIAIVFDTDTDGATSGAIIYRYLKHLGADPTPFIGRGKQHGLQKDDLEKFKKFNLLIIVDSLDSMAFNYEEVQTNSEVTDIVVLDHHAVNPKVPYDKWVTLVTSQRNYGNPELSGAGVCWKFCKYLDKIMEDDFADSLADLCATGLIADMMDMTVPENRYLVKLGLDNLTNPAISKICGGFGFDAKGVAFSIAPLVNASNRLDKNEYAMKVFIEDDNSRVLSNLKVLKQCKEDQNDEINNMMESVTEQCNKQLDKKMMIAFIETELGVAGLIANKLLEKYKRPIVILREDDDWYRGSMRAIGVDDFLSIINSTGFSRSFGHNLAGSCEFKKKDLQKFIDYMEDALPEVGVFEESMDVDILADVKDIDKDYIGYIQMLNRISGTGFPAIKVYLDGITNYEIDNMSQGKHLVIHIEDSELTLIQWNFNGDWDALEDAAMFGYELECCVELTKGFIGRKYYLQGIIQWLHIKE